MLSTKSLAAEAVAAVVAAEVAMAVAAKARAVAVANKANSKTFHEKFTNYSREVGKLHTRTLQYTLEKFANFTRDN